MSLKNGKKPLSQKGNSASISYDDVFGSKLALSPELKAELDSKGLIGRFVDSKKLYENQGYHEKGWRPYRRTTGPSDTIKDGQDFKLGSDPDGIVRRGTVILAVKTKEEHAKHKAFLEQQRTRYNQINKTEAANLKRAASDNDVAVEVFEGYEDND